MTSLPFALHAATARPRHGSSQAFITLTRRPLSVSRALHVLGSCVLCLAPPAVDLLEALGRCVCTRRAWCQPPRFNVVQVLCTPCSTPPLAEVLNMCNTTSELGVEHPRGPHRVQHVQHLFNTCLSQVLNNRKRDFSPPRAHWLSYPSIHGSSVCLWATVCVPSAEEVRQHQYTNLMLYVEPLDL